MNENILLQNKSNLDLDHLCNLRPLLTCRMPYQRPVNLNISYNIYIPLITLRQKRQYLGDFFWLPWIQLELTKSHTPETTSQKDHRRECVTSNRTKEDSPHYPWKHAGKMQVITEETASKPIKHNPQDIPGKGSTVSPEQWPETALALSNTVLCFLLLFLGLKGGSSSLAWSWLLLTQQLPPEPWETKLNPTKGSVRPEAKFQLCFTFSVATWCYAYTSCYKAKALFH